MQFTIRSYVRREGRMTAAQEAALSQYGSLYNSLGPVDRPVVLEIGFGNGAHLLRMAKQYPEMQFIGIEVHRPGVGTALRRIAEEGLTNVNICTEDAVEVLRDRIPENYIKNIQIFFPDPWHKRRHHKRRLISVAFVELLRSRLVQHGTVHIATDWEDYARYIMRIFSAQSGFDNQFGVGQYAPSEFTDPLQREKTAFEKRGLRLGHSVWDMVFIKA